MIYFDNAGPVIRYWGRDRMLHICDLNPETELRWKVTRWELVKIGLRCLLHAVKR